MRKRGIAAVFIVVGVGFYVWNRQRNETLPVGTAPVASKDDVRRTDKKETPEGRPDSMAAPTAVMIDDDPAGELPLEGIVFDVQEKPVAGAIVALASNPPRTVTSGEDGTFVFTKLVGRTYTVTARASSGVAGPVTARLTEKSGPLILHLRPGAIVNVKVTDSNGKPIDGATVELRDVDVQSARTPATGIATLKPVVPGGYSLVAWAPRLAKSYQLVRVSAGTVELAVTLVAGAAVSGRVIDEAGVPVVDARVRFSGASDWSTQGDDRLDAVTSAADGSFRFEAMPAGSFRFYATGGSYATGTSALVRLDGSTEKTGVEVKMPKGATVRGRVVDQAKQPVAAARVRIGAAARSMMSAEAPRQAYSDTKGEFEIKGLSRRELAAVAIAESGSSANVSIDTTAGDVNNVVLTLDLNGTISGVVVDVAGEPLEGVQVSAGPNFRGGNRDGANTMTNWRLRGFPEELTDSAGRFTLTGLAPGSYLINASRSRSSGRGRGPAMGEGVEAQAGAQNVKIVLPAEASLKGKLAFADGKSPLTFNAGVGFNSQTFVGNDGVFVLEGIAPNKYTLNLRGPAFESKAVAVELEAGKQFDIGTITVEVGRRVGGVVMHGDKPLVGATVLAGRQIFGSGSSSSAQFGPMNQGVKQATTGEDGSFLLSGFGRGDVTVVAEQAELGRSKAIVLAQGAPGQQELVINIAGYGSLTGTLKQGGKPAEGNFVTAQSTTVPGSLYSVASGPDGVFRFDKLAPDTYKVSATVGMPMIGMRFYSKVAVVESGKEVIVELTVVPGAVSVEVKAVASNGAVADAAVMMLSGVATAKTVRELNYQIAAAGQGTTDWMIMGARTAGSITFAEVAPGNFTVCVAPMPVEVNGPGAFAYRNKYEDVLPTFCKQVAVAASPANQSFGIPVVIPPFQGTPDEAGGGSRPPGGAGGRGGGGPPGQ